MSANTAVIEELHRAIVVQRNMEELEGLLWAGVLAYQGETFYTLSGLEFSYMVKHKKNGEYSGELLISRKETSKTLTRSSVMLAFHKVLEQIEIKENNGNIIGTTGKAKGIEAYSLSVAKENLGISTEEAENTAKMVALAAIKYGDLSNQASKDYIFDIDRFTSFEGNTGPYILYTIVRIKSILNKYHGLGKDESGAVIEAAHSKSEKDLMLELSKFNAVMESAFEETAPHKICSYIYDLANAFNSFYHGTKIMSEENEAVQKSYIRLLELTKSVLETCIDVLGFSAPERM